MGLWVKYLLWDFLTKINSEKPIKIPSGDIECEMWHTSWEFRGKLETRDVYLVVISI